MTTPSKRRSATVDPYQELPQVTSLLRGTKAREMPFAGPLDGQTGGSPFAEALNQQLAGRVRIDFATRHPRRQRRNLFRERPQCMTRDDVTQEPPELGQLAFVPPRAPLLGRLEPNAVSVELCQEVAHAFVPSRHAFANGGPPWARRGARGRGGGDVELPPQGALPGGTAVERLSAERDHQLEIAHG